MHLRSIIIIICTILQWHGNEASQDDNCSAMLNMMCKGRCNGSSLKEFCGKERNLAFRKPTKQTSTFKEFGIYKQSHSWSRNAVDGNFNPDWYTGGSCIHTKEQLYPCWEVDLESDYQIHKIIIANRGQTSARTDGDFGVGGRLRDLVVKVKPEKGKWKVFEKFPGPGKDGEIIELKRKVPMTGRHVRVQLNRKGYLHVCEVEVIGKMC